MYYEKDCCYHIYNIGNNAQKLFFNDNDYLEFLRKIRKEIRGNCEIIAYCLMPNHYHLMILTTQKSVSPVSNKTPQMQVIARKIGTLQSSYTQSINNRMNRSGSLFQQKTKAKSLHQNIVYPFNKPLYANTCFHYIHQNPVSAGLVEKNEDWQYSSFRDYSNMRNGNLCNKSLASKILEIDFDDHHKIWNKKVDNVNLKHIW